MLWASFSINKLVSCKLEILFIHEAQLCDKLIFKSKLKRFILLPIFQVAVPSIYATMADNSLSEYELLRLRNIKRNHEFMKSLGRYFNLHC